MVLLSPPPPPTTANHDLCAARPTRVKLSPPPRFPHTSLGGGGRCLARHTPSQPMREHIYCAAVSDRTACVLLVLVCVWVCWFATPCHRAAPFAASLKRKHAHNMLPTPRCLSLRALCRRVAGGQVGDLPWCVLEISVVDCMVDPLTMTFPNATRAAPQVHRHTLPSPLCPFVRCFFFFFRAAHLSRTWRVALLNTASPHLGWSLHAYIFVETLLELPCKRLRSAAPTSPRSIARLPPDSARVLFRLSRSHNSIFCKTIAKRGDNSHNLPLPLPRHHADAIMSKTTILGLALLASHASAQLPTLTVQGSDLTMSTPNGDLQVGVARLVCFCARTMSLLWLWTVCRH